jgi:hypothetical protein
MYMPQYYSDENHVQVVKWVRDERAVNLLGRSTNAWDTSIKLHDSNLDHKTTYKTKVPFPRKFVTRLNESSVNRVAVWKRLRLNQWSARTPHKPSRKWRTNLSIYMKVSTSQLEPTAMWRGCDKRTPLIVPSICITRVGFPPEQRVLQTQSAL